MAQLFCQQQVPLARVGWDEKDVKIMMRMKSKARSPMGNPLGIKRRAVGSEAIY